MLKADRAHFWTIDHEAVMAIIGCHPGGVDSDEIAGRLEWRDYDVLTILDELVAGKYLKRALLETRGKHAQILYSKTKKE